MVIKKRVWVFCSLGVLLFILAALQYRWIAEASRAEQERLRQNLSLATNRLAHDFESQFLHLGFTGRLIRTAGARLLESDFETDKFRATRSSVRRMDGVVSLSRITPGPVHHQDPR